MESREGNQLLVKMTPGWKGNQNKTRTDTSQSAEKLTSAQSEPSTVQCKQFLIVKHVDYFRYQIEKTEQNLS